MKGLLKALDQYQNYIFRIKAIDYQIDNIDDIVGVGVDGIDYSKSSGGGGTSDAVADIVALRESKLKKLEKEKSELELKKGLIDTCFSALSPKEETAMRKHYIDNYTWVDIADELDMSYQGLMTLRSRSLKKMNETYKLIKL